MGNWQWYILATKSNCSLPFLFPSLPFPYVLCYHFKYKVTKKKKIEHHEKQQKSMPKSSKSNKCTSKHKAQTEVISDPFCLKVRVTDLSNASRHAKTSQIYEDVTNGK